MAKDYPHNKYVLDDAKKTRKNKTDLAPHYLVHVEGTFYDKEQSGTKNIKKYKVKIPVLLRVTANVPKKVWDEKKGTHVFIDDVREVNLNDVGIRSHLLQSKRLENLVKKQAVNFIALREYIVTEVVPSHPSIALPTDPSVLKLAQLKEHITMNA